ncbi:hypothetical protein LNO81_04745 [Klebsiella variicola subsp. variicola]|nr:hypothetical protein [Klebsiella variicola subsp. variicola]
MTPHPPVHQHHPRGRPGRHRGGIDPGAAGRRDHADGQHSRRRDLLFILALILGIAQVPVILVTAPAIALMWSLGTHSTGMDIFYTILLIVAGMADNVLKPLLLGRGVDAPMPVVLLGALGGMASNGILGMFLGATLLAIGYRIFMTWVNEGQPALPQDK